MVCGTQNLVVWVEVGIEVGLHAMRLLWAHNFQEEYWGFLLIHALIEFNEENHMAMLLAVRHKWPSGAHFTFVCYHNWSTLVVRDLEVSVHFLHSR